MSQFRSRVLVLLGVTAVAASLAAPSQAASAQRRPGQNFGFYSTTGLLTADLEAGSVSSNNEFAEVPTAALSGLITTRVLQRPKRAWIVGVRGTVVSLGDTGQCLVVAGTDGCVDLRFTERVALLTGGAFDIRSTILRAMVGPALYSEQGRGARVGMQVRIDYAAPRLRGATPTLFLSRTMLGSQRGRNVGLGTFGAGLRWTRKN